MNPKDEYKVIGLGKPNEVSKSSWECRVSKRVKEVQRNQVAQGCPKKASGLRMPKRKTKGTQETISRKTNGHTKLLGERVNCWPKEAQQD